MLKEAVAGILSETEIEDLYGAFDQIGDIIILRIPDSLVSKKETIGKVLLEKVKTAKSVFYQSSPVSGDFRTRELELLAGEDKTETEYKEHGCRFIVDVENEQQSADNNEPLGKQIESPCERYAAKESEEERWAQRCQKARSVAYDKNEEDDEMLSVFS